MSIDVLLAFHCDLAYSSSSFRLVPNYYKLHEVSELVRDAGVNMRLSLLMDEESDEANTEKDRVMTLLLHLRRFRKARKFAAVLGLPDDHITLKEVGLVACQGPDNIDLRLLHATCSRVTPYYSKQTNTAFYRSVKDRQLTKNLAQKKVTKIR